MTVQYSPRHFGTCEYCMLAGHIRNEYEYSKQRVERTRYSNDPYDVEFYNKEVRVMNALYSFIEKMDKRFDALHASKQRR